MNNLKERRNEILKEIESKIAHKLDLEKASTNISEEIGQLNLEIEELETRLSEMHEYESIFILSIDTTLKRFQKIIDEVLEITHYYELEKMGIKKLAYEIKGNLEGYYVSVHFVGNYEIVKKLEKFYRFQDEIIKFITIRKADEEDIK